MYELLDVEQRSLESDVKPLRLRNNGMIPAILCSRGKDSIPLKVSNTYLRRFLLNKAHVFELQIDKKEKYLVSLDKVQKHPVSGKVLHVSFHELRQDEQTTIVVPIILEGQPKGLKSGGILVQLVHEVHVSGLPADLPESIKVNVDELFVGSHISLSDILPPKGITFDESDLEHMIATCKMPKVVKEEPEVVVAEEGAEGEDATAAAAPTDKTAKESPTGEKERKKG